MSEMYKIYEGVGLKENPVIMYTFPTSKGKKEDLINYGVLESIMDENIVIVSIQTRDDECFYSKEIKDEEKIRNVYRFIKDVEGIVKLVESKYKTRKSPIVYGCSMGGYYAHLMYMMNQNKYDCISLGGFCDIKIMDRKARHKYECDKVINYERKKEEWDGVNPIAIKAEGEIERKIMSCYGTREDEELMRGIVEFYERLKTWNYVGYYDMGHNFESWERMTRDIFKGERGEYHEFRKEFYE